MRVAVLFDKTDWYPGTIVKVHKKTRKRGAQAVTVKFDVDASTEVGVPLTVYFFFTDFPLILFVCVSC